MGFAIAIDGPAGAGKSTIAKAVAEKMDFKYIDTGAMYRTIALGLMRAGTDCSDSAALEAALADLEPGVDYFGGEQQMFLNGENVTELIRTPEVSQMASISSASPLVRNKLLKLQRDLASSRRVIMDGRDIGTLILPDAQLKIYLTASIDARAKRRLIDLQAQGMECPVEEIRAQIAERDYRDMHRETAPLRKADDAVEVDTSDMTIDEVVETISALARERLQEAEA